MEIAMLKRLQDAVIFQSSFSISEKFILIVLYLNVKYF